MLQYIDYILCYRKNDKVERHCTGIFVIYDLQNLYRVIGYEGRKISEFKQTILNFKIKYSVYGIFIFCAYDGGTFIKNSVFDKPSY